MKSNFIVNIKILSPKALKEPKEESVWFKNVVSFYITECYIRRSKNTQCSNDALDRKMWRLICLKVKQLSMEIGKIIY